MCPLISSNTLEPPCISQLHTDAALASTGEWGAVQLQGTSEYQDTGLCWAVRVIYYSSTLLPQTGISTSHVSERITKLRTEF
jgi:hypothetical protein